MGFDIVHGNVGFLGGLVILVAISMAIIVAIVFFTVAKRARETVIEEDEDADRNL